MVGGWVMGCRILVGMVREDGGRVVQGVGRVVGEDRKGGS